MVARLRPAWVDLLVGVILACIAVGPQAEAGVLGLLHQALCGCERCPTEDSPSCCSGRDVRTSPKTTGIEVEDTGCCCALPAPASAPPAPIGHLQPRELRSAAELLRQGLAAALHTPTNNTTAHAPMLFAHWDTGPPREHGLLPLGCAPLSARRVRASGAVVTAILGVARL